MSRDGGRTEVVTLVLTGIAVNAMTSAGAGVPDVPRRHPGPRGDRLLDARQPQRLPLGVRRRRAPDGRRRHRRRDVPGPQARPARARRPGRPPRRRRRRAAADVDDRRGRRAHRRGRRVLRDHRVRRPGRAAPGPDGRRPGPPAAGAGERPRRRRAAGARRPVGAHRSSPTPTCRSACSPRSSAARSSSGCSAAPVVRRGAGHERTIVSARGVGVTHRRPPDPRPTSTSTSAAARSSRWSDPTAPASRPCSASSPATSTRAPAGSRSTTRRSASYSARELARQRAVQLQKQGLAFGFRVARGGPDGPLAVAPHRARGRRRPRGRGVDGARRRHRRSADRLFPTLSGGEQARTSFARVLAQETPVLLLDEPTAALDIRHQESLLAVARAAAAGRRRRRRRAARPVARGGVRRPGLRALARPGARRRPARRRAHRRAAQRGLRAPGRGHRPTTAPCSSSRSAPRGAVDRREEEARCATPWPHA